MAIAWRRWIAGTSITRTLIRATILGLMLYTVLSQWARPLIVRGISMEPTIRDGTIRLARMQEFRHLPPPRGAIVVIALPGGKTFYAKRVVGLPGEAVAFVHGSLMVNGRPIEEPYLANPGTWDAPQVQLGDNEYYVVGDNRSMPIDEQVAGVVNIRHIKGGLW